jgi:hypothetical protein
MGRPAAPFATYCDKFAPPRQSCATSRRYKRLIGATPTAPTSPTIPPPAPPSPHKGGATGVWPVAGDRTGATAAALMPVPRRHVRITLIGRASRPLSIIVIASGSPLARRRREAGTVPAPPSGAPQSSGFPGATPAGTCRIRPGSALHVGQEAVASLAARTPHRAGFGAVTANRSGREPPCSISRPSSRRRC